MAISSSSTIAQILDQYEDNAGYESNGSLAEAKLFATACRMLLSPRRTPEMQAHDGEMVRIDTEALREELKKAEQFILNGGARVRSENIIHYGLDNYRD